MFIRSSVDEGISTGHEGLVLAVALLADAVRAEDEARPPHQHRQMSVEVPEHRRESTVATVQQQVDIIFDAMLSGIRDRFAQMLLLLRRAGELRMLFEDQVVLEPAWHSCDHDVRFKVNFNTESAPQGMFFVDVHAATK